MYQLKNIIRKAIWISFYWVSKKYIDNATTDKYTWGDELVNEIINPW